MMSFPSVVRAACLVLTGSPLAFAAHAQSIEPDSVAQIVNVGESFTISKTIAPGVAGASTIDALFLADNTGSFSVLAQGMDAPETHTITVASEARPIPEPSAYALMLAGLAAAGAIARRMGRRDNA